MSEATSALYTFLTLYVLPYIYILLYIPYHPNTDGCFTLVSTATKPVIRNQKPETRVRSHEPSPRTHPPSEFIPLIGHSVLTTPPSNLLQLDESGNFAPSPVLAARCSPNETLATYHLHETLALLRCAVLLALPYLTLPCTLHVDRPAYFLPSIHHGPSHYSIETTVIPVQTRGRGRGRGR